MTAVFQATHTLYYTTEKPVPIPDVIASLQALNELLKDVPKLVGALTGTTIEGAEFYIDELASGSLLERIIVRFLFKDDAGLDAFVDKLRDNGVIRTTIIAAAIGMLVMQGIQLARGSDPAPNVTVSNNTIINIGADAVGKQPGEVEAIVRAVVADKQRATAENAVKLLAPARSDASSKLVINGEDAQPLEISAEAIRETPTRVERVVNERIEERNNVQVHLRAMDLDKADKGWAGRLEGMEQRLPIELDPELDKNALFGKTSVKADIYLIHKANAAGTLKPNRIYIRSLRAS